MIIRKAEMADLPALTKIYNDAILHTVSTFDMEIKDESNRMLWFREHDVDPYVIIVAETEGVIAGYASLSRYRDRKAFDGSVEVSLYIEESHQKMGVGSMLFAEILRIAESNPAVHSVVSLVTGENEHSIYLHRKFGFTYCGQFKQVGYKDHRWLDLNFYQIVYE